MMKKSKQQREAERLDNNMFRRKKRNAGKPKRCSICGGRFGKGNRCFNRMCRTLRKEIMITEIRKKNKLKEEDTRTDNWRLRW